MKKYNIDIRLNTEIKNLDSLDADEIIMLEQGVVKERGTHEELMKQEGAYAALLHSD